MKNKHKAWQVRRAVPCHSALFRSHRYKNLFRRVVYVVVSSTCFVPDERHHDLRGFQADLRLASSAASTQRPSGGTSLPFHVPTWEGWQDEAVTLPRPLGVLLSTPSSAHWTFNNFYNSWLYMFGPFIGRTSHTLTSHHTEPNQRVNVLEEQRRLWIDVKHHI